MAYTASHADLVRAWVHGWARSRGTSPPVALPSGWRIEVGLPGHIVRVVLAHTSEAVVEQLVASAPVSGTWLKVCGSVSAIRPLLTAAWCTRDPEYLMSASLAAPPRRREQPHDVQIDDVRPGVVDVRVQHAGATAASGRVAVYEDAAVFDQVATDPAHRRRGFGSLVMAELSRQAVLAGARGGVLVATGDGLGLYRQLGWALRSPVTAAVVTG
jgi:GNAT superfamily N-acetyltransferase